MQQPAQTQSASLPRSFAGLLATLASPQRNDPDPDAVFDASDLAEDVATLSYERALRAHATYKPEECDGWNTAPSLSMSQQPGPFVDNQAKARILPELATPDRDLRTTSVTIRLSKGEWTRVHQLAAEAGLTISAYLRSCTFEAESLRAQVKAALAELRSPAGCANETAREPARAEVRLARVLGHIGKLWIGISSGK